MNNWGNPWQPGYYQQPAHPHVYIPPQPYGRPPAGYWDQPAWNRPNPAEGQTVPGYRSNKYPNLNPILAADTTLLRFNVKKKPQDDILTSTYFSNRHLPAFATPVIHIRLISKAFPWSIDIMAGGPVTCDAVWDALHGALQEPIADSEWALIVGEKKQRENIQKAAKKRAEIDQDKRLKRIDWLGDATFFKGLEKDEDFEKLRLLPGAKECAETWAVRFGS